MTINVLCVDDSADITRLMCMTIAAEADMDVVGELQRADGLLDEVQEKQPDVLLIDLTMPGTDVLASIAKVTNTCPNTRTIVYSGYDDQGNIDRAIEAGAWGYVSKNVELDKLIEAIRRVANGEVVSLT